MKWKLLLVLCAIVLANGLSQATNPFDIIRSGSVESVPAETVVIPEETSIPSTKLESDNPFSVSHVPIRKNQYEEIKRLTQTDKVVEENISLLSLPLWLIILSLCGLAFLVYRKKDHFTLIVRSITNENFMRMTNLDENRGFTLHYIIGYLIYLINMALFIYLLITRYFNETSELLSQPIAGGWPFYLKLLGIISFFFLGKHVMNKLFGAIFNVSKEADLYDFTIISFYNLLAVFLLFLNVLIVFGPGSWMKALAVMGSTIFIIFLLSRLYRGIRIGRNQVNNHFFHFFLYFCAFEISPWIVVYTLTKDFF